MHCDMCGKESQLYKANIEGSFLKVCSECGKYGEVISKIEEEKPKPEIRTTSQIERSEIIKIIVPNYSSIIRSGRESMGLKQKEFAEKLAEKESVIHKLESGHMKPSIDLARKLEKFLKVKLVEQYEEKSKSFKPTENSGMTVADFIKK